MASRESFWRRILCPPRKRRPTTLETPPGSHSLAFLVFPFILGRYFILQPCIANLGFTLTDDGTLEGPSIAETHAGISEQGRSYSSPAGPTGSAKDCTFRFQGDRVIVTTPDGQQIEVTGVRAIDIKLMKVSGPGKVGIIL